MRQMPTGRLRFGILGPLMVEVGGSSVHLGGPRQRSVLALLLLKSGQVVPVDRIIDALWESDPPPTAESTLRGYVSHLRKALVDPAQPASPGPLVTRPSGYQLEVEPDQLDANRFERLYTEGRRLFQVGGYADAARLLHAALRLWRGPALADLAAQLWARAHCTRLEELRQVVMEARVEADLALGRHAELVSELEVLVAEHPLREPLHAHRMLALYRSGRQADALDAYRQAYVLLAGERGIDPGSALREMESAILHQDPGLDWIPPLQPAAVLDESAGVAASASEPATSTGSAGVSVRVAVGVVVPAELPADVAAFTGRVGALAVLDALLDEGEGADGESAAVVVSAIGGAGGMGKTALAVHWGHRVRDRFPDGQLYVNLRGYVPGDPVRPVEALGRFLRALGVPADQVPVEAEEAAARYRSVLAGRRVLVVLDNAASAEQVRPLLPANRDCVVVVTSRDRLAGLVARDGAVPLPLDVLTPAEAGALVERVVGADRMRSEPEAATELAELCGRLPLALRIAAATLLHRPGTPIAGYVAELREADRLSALAAEGDEQSGVRAAFDLSYARLARPARRLFRLLGVVPGADFTAEVAAALTGDGPEEACRLLDGLAGVHLVERPSPGRYGFHDLLRLYAAELAHREDAEEDRRAALTRLFDHYRASAAGAMEGAFPEERYGRSVVASPATPTRPADPAQARAWLDAERANLVAVVAYAAQHDWPDHACDLAGTLWPYLRRGPHYTDAIVINNHALHAARSRGDSAVGADALTNLGSVSWQTGRPAEAMEYLQQALALRREVGDRAGEGWTLNNLASVHWSCGRYRQFSDHCQQALDIFRGVGDRIGEYTALNNLGMVYPGEVLVGPTPRDPGDAARVVAGTSQSSAYAAGVAALLWAANPGLSTDSVESILLRNMRMSPDGTVGRRVIHALDAVRDALPAVIAIVRPNDGATLPAGAPAEFRAEVFEDGHGSPRVTWRLGNGTELGSGHVISAVLPVGIHQVIATAAFPDGTTVTDQIRVTVENRAPTVRIIGPRNPDGSTPTFARSEPITFRGASFDPDVGPLREDQVSWHLDGAAASFAINHSATVSLGAGVGEHTVTFRGCDGFGSCAEDTITIAIREDPPNLPPTVRITNPANGAILPANGSDADGRFHELTLGSDASDPEGGPVTLVWTASTDGGPPVEIGTGPSPTVRLRAPCEGSRHQLTLVGTDNVGNSRQDVVNVAVVTSC